MRTVGGWCPKCEEDSLEFDFGGISSGPGLRAFPEIGDLMKQTCDCVLSEQEIELARVRAEEAFCEDDGPDDGRYDY